jgi:hypothetical protein
VSGACPERAKSQTLLKFQAILMLSGVSEQKRERGEKSLFDIIAKKPSDFLGLPPARTGSERALKSQRIADLNMKR